MSKTYRKNEDNRVRWGDKRERKSSFKSSGKFALCQSCGQIKLVEDFCRSGRCIRCQKHYEDRRKLKATYVN